MTVEFIIIAFTFILGILFGYAIVKEKDAKSCFGELIIVDDPDENAPHMVLDIYQNHIKELDSAETVQLKIVRK